MSLPRSYLRACILLLVWAFLRSNVKAGEISGRIYGSDEQMVYLYALLGAESLLMDSTRIAADGTLTFLTDAHYPTGFYFLRLANGSQIYLILDGESVHFTTCSNAVLDSLQVTKSRETALYYSLIRTDQAYHHVRESLKQLLEVYQLQEPNAAFVKTITAELDTLPLAISRLKDRMVAEYPGSLVAKLHQASKLPRRADDPLQAAKYSDEKSFLREHFFDNIDFSDVRLLRTPFLTGNYKQFLDWLEPREENAYLQAVDMLLSHAKVDNEVYSSTLFFLIKYFSLKEFPVVSEKLTGLCQTDAGCQSAERRMQKLGITAGSRAPALSLPDASGIPIALQSLHSDFILLIFWSPECESCHAALQQLPVLRKTFPPERLQFYTVALHEDETLWRNSLIWPESDWINTIDRLGHHSPLPAAFNIRSIPAFYLINRQGRVVAALQQLAAVLTQLQHLPGSRAGERWR